MNSKKYHNQQHRSSCHQSAGQKIKQQIQVTSKWLRAVLRLWFSPFNRRYNLHLQSQHRALNFPGQPTTGMYVPELKQVFVEPHLAISYNPQQTHFDLIINQQLQGQHPIWDFLRLGHGHTPLVLAILGAPGTGKTTLQQHLALTFAANQQYQYYLKPLTPILLFLPNHLAWIEHDSATKTPTLPQLIYEHQNNLSDLKAPPHWFAQQLKKGKCLVLLDGLSEVANLKHRQIVSNWIEKQIHDYPNCPFIITARPQGYLMAPITGAHILEVQPLNTAQAQQLTQAWYLATQANAFGGQINDQVRHRAKLGSQQLLEHLANTPTLRPLADNPLLLTMTVMLHRYQGQFPKQRLDLYAQIGELLLDFWISPIQKQSDPLTKEQKWEMLQTLAAQMMFKQISSISSQPREILSDSLKPIKLDIPKNQIIIPFLNHLQNQNGLLLENETGQWRFAHLTIQEYLAAADLLKQPTIPLNWNQFVNDSWWYETLRFLIAQSDATPIMQASVAQHNATAFQLAADGLEKYVQLDVEVRRQIESRMIDNLEAKEPQIRQLSAQIQLNQRLKRLQRIDERREIDCFYITCAEYQLFLDETRAQGRYHQPDHWSNDTFAEGTALEPICGIRAEDAKAFCDWLTERQGGQMFYRLPQPAEARSYPATAKSWATWCQLKSEDNDSIYGLIWLTKADKQFIETQLKKLADLPLSQNYTLAHTEVVEGLMVSSLTKLHVHQAIGLAIEVNLDIAPHLFSDLDLAFAHSLAFSRAEVSPSDRFHAHAIAVANMLALALVLNYAHSSHYKSIYRAIKRADLTSVYQQIEALPTERLPIYQPLLGSLLRDIKECVTATDSQQLRQAWRQYTARLVKLLWKGYVELEQQHYARSWLWKFLHRSPNYDNEKNMMLSLYWWLRIIVARQEGQLPAWESIRIVRERK